MLITKLSDLINPEVMADMISAKVEKKIALLPYATVNTDLEGQEGDTITIPRFEPIGDAVEVAEGENIPMRTLTTSSVKYSIKKIGLGVTLTDEAVLSAHGNIVGETNTQLADSIAQKTDNDVVDEAYKAKTVFVADGVIGYDGIVDFMIYNSGELPYFLPLLPEHTDHYIYLSSYRVYDNKEHPVRETSPRLIDSSDDGKCFL